MKHVDMSHYFEGFEKSKRSHAEEEILAFWEENSIFKKTLEKPAPMGDYIFYEGPPTANGRPGIHHFLARSFKDAIPRYKTMRGFRVQRKAGWDTHGLPVELQVEKKLGLNSKHEIADYGLEKFNDACRESVWEYTSEWEAMTKRMAYWVDMEDPYITYETPYIESVWNILKKVSDDGLLYKDFRITPWCPRCGTTLSSHELAQGYEDVKDLSVTAAFELVNPSSLFKNIEGSVYVLAWTTTPWTLFGNVALAVGPEISYSLVKKFDDHTKYYVVATDLVSKIFGTEVETVDTILGAKIEGLSYKPLFNYAAEIIKEQSTSEQFEKAYKIHTADFVTTTDGTGVVHTAVMYGADDFDLGTKIGLPKVHMVLQDGTYVSGLEHFSGRFVKDEEVAIDVIKALAEKGNLFSKLKYEHSYPHCWRCKTPIIYYARDSWYIEMTKLAQEIVAKNETINWNPSHIKEGRFGEWLRNLKDWALSRERYWGTPLPVWVAQSGKRITIGSLAELSALSTKPTTEFVLIRHGHGTHLAQGIMSGDIHHDTAVLTETGKQQVKETAQKYKDEISSADVIYVSPFARTKQTLEILQQELSLTQEVIVDNRLSEVNFGSFNGASHDGLAVYFEGKDAFDTAYPDGESLRNVQHRVAQFVAEVQEQHAGKKVLVVSHDDTLSILAAICDGITTRTPVVDCFEPAECKIKVTTKLPVNHQGEVDLHKPFIDAITLVKDDEIYTRAPEVIDCWFDSGAMPYAQHHIPFENLDKVTYPADYITEGLDQTRGWFYTLLAIATLLGKEAPYKNVICLGLLLDEKGQKMSKSKGNIVSPWKIFSSVGSDVARMWLYGVNQPGESKMFDLASLQDLERKLFVILENCFEFYKLSPDTQTSVNTELIKRASYMDQWMLVYHNKIRKEITTAMEQYDLFTATRTLREFVTELSQWYVRRSREALRNEDEDGLATRHVYRIVLREIALMMAPFAPFHAESYFKMVKFEHDEFSVHLAPWPAYNENCNEVLLLEMDVVRDCVNKILQKRAEVKINVRQPLASATVPFTLSQDQIDIITDETNVKNIITSSASAEVVLDTELSDELLLEGLVRELTRAIQSKRKNLGMTVDQEFEITIKESELVEDIKQKFGDEIFKKTKTTLTVVSDIENPETISSPLGDIHIV